MLFDVSTFDVSVTLTDRKGSTASIAFIAPNNSRIEDLTSKMTFSSDGRFIAADLRRKRCGPTVSSSAWRAPCSTR